MQEVLKNKNCRRGSVSVPISKLSMQALGKERRLEVIRYNCSFPFETVCSIADSFSKFLFLSVVPFFAKLFKGTIYTNCLHATNTHPSSKASLPKTSSDRNLKSPNHCCPHPPHPSSRQHAYPIPSRKYSPSSVFLHFPLHLPLKISLGLLFTDPPNTGITQDPLLSPLCFSLPTSMYFKFFTLCP